MSLEIGKNIRKDVCKLDLNKIVRHEVQIEGLELYLTQWSEWNEHYSASIRLKGFSNQLYNIKEWKRESIEKVKKEYEELLEKLKKGKYVLHIYDNGKVEVEFK